MNQEYVTTDIFGDAMQKIDRQFMELKKLMMEGFGMLDGKIDIVEENLSSKIDELAMTKAEREEVFALHKRITKIEKRVA